MSPETETEARHPIRVAARRTGVTPAALRAWERRYGAVVPSRSSGGQRLYSDRDVRRLRLLKEAVDGGRAISQVAGMETGELERIVREDRRGAAGLGAPWVPPGSEVTAAATLEAAMGAVEEMVPGALEEILRRGAVTLPPPVLVDDVLVPLLRRIGERWRSGALGPAGEHLASTVIRRFLEWLAEAAETGVGAPVLLAATPAGQRHEFGALLAGVTGALAGWRVVFLGADLPAGEIAAAARGTGAGLVVLSALVADDPEVGRELEELREALPVEVGMLVGGPGVEGVRRRLEEMGVRYVEDLPGFRELLAQTGTGAMGVVGGIGRST